MGSGVIARKSYQRFFFKKRPQESEISCGFFAPEEGVSLRPMAPADLDEVMAIERDSFVYPWSSRFFLQELEVECARSILVEVNRRIVGYILFWLLPDEIDIHNIAVHKEFRRRGLGRFLIHQVIARAQRRLSIRVTLEVRVSNSSARRLYESMGFVITGLRRGYYSDNGEDALAMALNLR
jgi:[ribosomal protein S18]-alanine N-acetyltransferase